MAKPMVRHGECNQCGWCCQFLSVNRMTVPARDVSADSSHFYQLRHGIHGGDGKVRLVVHMFVPCQQHDNVAKRCGAYEERPTICRDFPSSPDQIEGTPCTHWFEEAKDDGTIERRGGLDSPYSTPPRFG